MIYDIRDETLEALMGCRLVGFSRDPRDMTMYRILLSDGRTIVFPGLEILLPQENVCH